MRETWEREAAFYQQRRREADVPPWMAARRCRRRLLISLAVNIALAIALLAARAR